MAENRGGVMTWHESRGMTAPEEPMSLITIPDIRQESDHDCGDAAIDAALGALGVHRKAGTKLANPVQGMAADTAAAILRASGVAVLAGPMVTGVDGLKHFTQAGCPVLCPIAEKGGHWVVVRGVARSRVHFHCPVDGDSSRRVSEWLKVWHDSEGESGHPLEQWGIVAWVPR